MCVCVEINGSNGGRNIMTISVAWLELGQELGYNYYTYLVTLKLAGVVNGSRVFLYFFFGFGSVSQLTVGFAVIIMTP